MDRSPSDNFKMKGPVNGPNRSAEPFAGAPFDVDTLVGAYRELDEGRNGGRGESESTDSGVLGWSESRFLDSYVKLYEVTGDEIWLDKLVDHTERILASRHDHHGDGPTWVTKRYCVVTLHCEPLNNRGTATIAPIDGRRWFRGGDDVEDGEFLLEVTTPGRYELTRWPSRRRVAIGALRSGAVIDDLQPFKFAVTGRPRIGDTFRIQTRAPQTLEHREHQGQLLYPLALFCEIVTGDSSLKKIYGDAVRPILQLASEIATRHERDWLDIGRGAGAYREPPCLGFEYPNRIESHNKYLTLGRAYLVLASLSRRRLFRERAEAMAKHFRRHLVRTGRAWTWAYWGDLISIIPEDTAHSQVDVGFAVEACRRGVVFRPADMRRFARTLLDQMWNGSLKEPRIGAHVNTRVGDAIRFGGWIDLCEWEPEVFDVLWALFDRNGRPGVHAPSILRGWLRRSGP